MESPSSSSTTSSSTTTCYSGESIFLSGTDYSSYYGHHDDGGGYDSSSSYSSSGHSCSDGSLTCEEEELLLQTIQAEADTNKSVLYLERLSITKTLARAIIQLLQHESRRRRERPGDDDDDDDSGWTKLVIADCFDNAPLQEVITVAMRHFSNVIISDMVLQPKLERHDTSSSLLHVIADGLGDKISTVRRFELRELTLDENQATTLARGLSATSLHTIRLGAVRFSDTPAVAALGNGLQKTNSLRKIQLTRCELNDEQVSLLVEKLYASRNNTLESLDLIGNHCRRGGLEALSRYLSQDHCSLRTLKLGDQFYKKVCFDDDFDENENVDPASVIFDDEVATMKHLPKTNKLSSSFPIEALLPGLQVNTSLRHLGLSRNQLQDARPIFQILQVCPHLVSLDLLGNRVQHLHTDATFHGRRTISSRLQRLELGYNSLSWTNNATVQSLVRLLQDHPQLECLTRSMSQGLWSSTPNEEKNDDNTDSTAELRISIHRHASSSCNEWSSGIVSSRHMIQHFLDWNKTGRTLVANNKMKQATWPLVLDRANRILRHDKARQANALFHLIQGGCPIGNKAEHGQ